jgi:hypothetical protein
MVFFVTRFCFDRSRLYFLLMSTKNIDRASIDRSIGGGWDSPVALAPSFASLLQYLPCEAPMPFSIRPNRRFPVQCAVTYNAGPFFKLPLASCSGFGAAHCVRFATCQYR